jgi:hypothetical protein
MSRYFGESCEQLWEILKKLDNYSLGKENSTNRPGSCSYFILSFDNTILEASCSLLIILWYLQAPEFNRPAPD